MSYSDNRNWLNDGRDFFDQPIQVGDKVLRASMSGRSPMFEVREVVELKDGKVYINKEYGEGKVAIHYSGRLMVLFSNK